MIINTKLDTIISAKDIKCAYIDHVNGNMNLSEFECIRNILSMGMNIYLRLEDPSPEIIERVKHVDLNNESIINNLIPKSYVDCIRAGTNQIVKRNYCFLENNKYYYKIKDREIINKIIRIHNEALLSYVIGIY